MFVVITDSEAIKEFERAFLESGDRVHPGGLSLLFTVVPDADATATLGFLRGVRDQANVKEVTKIFSLPAEDVS